MRRACRAIERAKAFRFAFQCGFELLQCLCGVIHLQEHFAEKFP